MKFSAKISIITMCLFLVSMSAMLYIGYAFVTGIVEQNVRERMEGQAFQIIDKIDRTLFERFADISVLATDSLLRSRTSTPRQITQRLTEYSEKYRIYSSLSFFNMNRMRIADTSGKDLGKRHALTAYWREITDGRDMVMEVTESQAEKMVVIHFAATVRNRQGRRIGVIATRLPIERIHQIADQTFRSGSKSKIRSVQLLDANGLILYSSYKGKGIFREKSDDWEHIKGVLAQGGNVGSSRHIFKGEEEITAFARERGHDTFRGNRWVLTLSVPAKIAFAAAHAQTKKFIALFLGFGLVVTISTFLVSHAATRTLNELGRAAAEIGKGNRDVSVRVRSDDEIGQLAKTFNDMALDLKESEGKYRNLAELLPQIVYEIDGKGEIVFANNFALKLFGYTQDDLLNGLSAFQMVIPEDRDRIGEKIQKVLRGEQIEGIEYGALKKDGSCFPVLAFASPIIRKKKTIGIRGIGIDITERKRTEDRIKNAEQEWERTFDSITAPIMILDIHHKIMKANKAMAGKLGVTPSEAIGLTCYQAVHDNNEVPEFCPHSKLLADNQIHSSEIYEERLGGHYIITVSPLFTPEGTLYGSVHYAVDITERKKTEEALRDGDETLRNILETTLDGFIRVDRNGILKEINSAYCKQSGYTREELLGLSISELEAVEKSAETTAHLQRLIENGHEQFETVHRRKNGSIWHVEVSCTYRRGGGQIIAFMRDITERKQAEETVRKMNTELEVKVRERTNQLLDAQDELVRKEKLATLGQVAGTVGHELRNPLGVMSNAVFFLQTVLTDANETTKEYLGIIKSEIAGAEQIVSDLLDAVRTKPPQLQLVLAEDLIRMSLEKCSIPERVTVEVLSTARGAVLIDPLQMKQVFINLINNAVDAMPKGGELRVSARRTVVEKMGSWESDNNPKDLLPSHLPNVPTSVTDLIEITVADTGCGILPENMGKIFQPLFTTKARGIGLGLVVVKNLTEANGGKVCVESEINRGTLFTVTLPAQEA